MKSKPISNSGKTSEYKCQFIGRVYKKGHKNKKESKYWCTFLGFHGGKEWDDSFLNSGTVSLWFYTEFSEEIPDFIL
jgi:hypothetical protein